LNLHGILLPLGPEPSASANFATWAGVDAKAYPDETLMASRPFARFLRLFALAACTPFCAAATASASPFPGPPPEVETIAGNGTEAFSGDGGPAVKAGVGQPFGLVIGPDRALYVCSTSNHCIRRVDLKTGLISTVVGTGRKGYAGDDGPADKAECNEPYELRFDKDGHLYEVEMKNHVVRVVDAKTKTIRTIAGTGMAGFDPAEDGGPALKARLNQPHSIALGTGPADGKLFIADILNHRVRVVDLATGKIDTFAGTGAKGPVPDFVKVAGTPVSGPRAIDFDEAGHMLLALREGNALLRVDLRAKEPTYSRLAGTGKSGYTGDGGPARDALLSGPKGVAVGPDGDIYLADTESHTIRVVRAKTGIIETVVGDGKPGDGPDGPPLKCRLNRPHGVFVDEGILYIGDSSNHKVRRIDLSPEKP
jgi:sugar lactone lactonase YvrE